MSEASASLVPGTVPAPATPTVLHVNIFRFGRRHHPGIWRTITGLSGFFRNVVLSGQHPGYFPVDDRDLNQDGSPVKAATEIAVVGDQNLSGLLRPEVAASFAASLTQRYGPIHAVVGHLGCGARSVALARQLSVPIMAIFHGDDANIQLRDRQRIADSVRLRSAPAAFFLAVSQNLVDRLIDFGMPPERTFLHHLGVDLVRYRVADRPRTAGPIKVVMAGRFRRVKGHEMALRGFAKFAGRFPGASLHLIGSGERPDQEHCRSEIQALAARVAPAGSIRFRGQMPVEALADEFGEADLGLQTSVFVPAEAQVEGVPNTILEAMATGLPMVATRHGGIPEAVLHERSGLLVAEHDVEGLAAALERLAVDPALRRRYGIAGRKHIEAEFNSVRQSERLAHRIREMIAAYGSMSPRDREATWNA